MIPVSTFILPRLLGRREAAPLLLVTEAEHQARLADIHLHLLVAQRFADEMKTWPTPVEVFIGYLEGRDPWYKEPVVEVSNPYSVLRPAFSSYQEYLNTYHETLGDLDASKERVL